jgi:copper resistance protein D
LRCSDSSREIRFALAIILAGCLAYDRFPLARGLASAMSLGLIAALDPARGIDGGEIGVLHLAANIFHLFAAAIWMGGPVSLVLLLSAVGRNQTHTQASHLRGTPSGAFRRWASSLSLQFFVTGIVNAWILVGSWHTLIVTGYGRLPILKLALFAIMLLIAAANRFWLAPRLALPSDNEPQRMVLRRLACNGMIEIALALMIFAIVGLLSTLLPAIHFL